jgi:sulfatase modifying factor 1
MKPLPSFFAVLIASCMSATPASGEDQPETNPGAPIVWTSKVGSSITARFIRTSGDMVVLDEDGRERQFSIGDLAEKSARLARQLGGIDEPLAPAPVAKPLRMKFEPVNAGLLDTASRVRTGKFPLENQKVANNRFQMGSPADEPGREESEPSHMVRFEREFLLKATEVTWAEWNSVSALALNYDYTDLSPGTNGQGAAENDQHPVVNITWWDAVKWCNLLSQIEDRTAVYYTHPSCKPGFILKTGTPVIHVDWTANGYRLPTEAEWEFACRPGTSKRAFHTGPIKETGIKPVDRNLAAAGWFAGNSEGRTHPVATRESNRLNLYDMHGNAAEWCWDRAGQLGSADAIDPRGAEHGEARVIRGGSWLDPAKNCRAAWRGSRNPTAMPNPSVGFRPAVTVPRPDTK